MNLTVRQALRLVQHLDEKLKRPDFNSFMKLGVDFRGYRGAFGIQHSGCSKVDCITSIVGYLIGEGLGPDPENVATWLDEKVPGWKKEIGYEHQGIETA